MDIKDLNPERMTRGMTRDDFKLLQMADTKDSDASDDDIIDAEEIVSKDQQMKNRIHKQQEDLKRQIENEKQNRKKKT